MILAPRMALNLADAYTECEIMSGIAMETCQSVSETVATDVCELTIKCHCDAHFLVYNTWLTISNNSYPAKN